jgi:exopolyphosphatase/guanosine-5'-triphosphate,3'-diphosphate pyrophosphatase
VRYIDGEIDAFVKQIVSAGFDRVIGTSGTILSLGAVAVAAARGTVPTELRNLRVPAKQIRRVREKVTSLPLAERLRLPGLDPRRADIIVAGAVLLDTILSS